MSNFIYWLGAIVFFALFLWGAIITYLSGKPNHHEHGEDEEGLDILDLPIFTNPKCKYCDRLTECKHHNTNCFTSKTGDKDGSID